jgi:hypothetical protein
LLIYIFLYRRSFTVLTGPGRKRATNKFRIWRGESRSLKLLHPATLYRSQKDWYNNNIFSPTRATCPAHLILLDLDSPPPSPLAQQPNTDQGCLFLEVFLSTFSETRQSQWNSSGWGIGQSQRHLPDNTQYSQETDIHAPAGFEPATPPNNWAYTLALHRSTVDSGTLILLGEKYE